MLLSINQEIGIRCLTQDDGQKIYDMSCGYIMHDIPLTLDFRDVIQFASPFFNYSIGQLIVNFNEERFNALVKVINLNPIGTNIYKRVIANAITFISNSNYRSSLSAVLDEHSEL